jgi:hypothetical protein
MSARASVSAILWFFLAIPKGLAIEEPFCLAEYRCSDDELRIHFADGTSEIRDAVAGQIIDVSIIADVKSRGAYKVSFGLRHDPVFLELQESSLERVFDKLVYYGKDGEEVLVDAPQNMAIDEFVMSKGRLEGFGYWAYFNPLDDQYPHRLYLPVGDGLVLARARYKVLVSPAAGTKLYFSHYVAHGDQIGDSLPNFVENALIYGLPRLPCPPEPAFYFGSYAKEAAHDLAGDGTLALSMRNIDPVHAFSLGIRKDGDRLTFESTLGPAAGQEVALSIQAGDGEILHGDPLKGNSARGAPLEPIASISRGAALVPHSAVDFFRVDLAPGAGGPGATVEYVADPQRAGQEIPGVEDFGLYCGVNEILVVQVGPVQTKFSRGDANGDGRIDITDVVGLLKNVFFAQDLPFDCSDAIEVNDDGTLDILDPIYLLEFLFRGGAPPANPYKACGVDRTADGIPCRESNCK